MSYGKLVIRHGFFDFEYAPFAGYNITCSRRAQSAPATLTRLHGASQTYQNAVHVDENSDVYDKLLEEVRASRARLDSRIANTRQLRQKSTELLEFVNICNSERFTRATRTFLMSLATAYKACLEELLMKMLFNILHMHHDRGTGPS